MTLPVSDEATLAAKRQSTEDLIASAPLRVALMRPAAPVATGTGAFVRTGQPTPQRPKTRYFGPTTKYDLPRTEDERYISQAVLIGPYNDDIREGDYFVLENITYTVKYIVPGRSFQTKAVVEAHSGG